MEPPWGQDVVAGRYGGHDGLVYRTRPRTFADLLYGVQRWAPREFLVHGDRRITFGEFFAAVDRARERLAPLGISTSDRVVLLGYNSPDWVLALWAIWSLGGVPVLGNRWWSAAEAAYCLELTTPRAVITDAPELIDGPVVDIAELRACFGGDSAQPPAIPGPGDEEDPAVILFTSGSTGMPKAVELPFRSVVANQQNVLARSRQLPQNIPADSPQPVNLISTPLFHIGAFATLITQTITGGRIVFNLGRFDPVQVLSLIDSERVERWGAVPTMAIRLLEHPEFESHDLSTLRSFPLGGAPVPPVLLERLINRLPQLQGRGLVNMWGMTEGGGFFTVAAGPDLQRFPRTVGRALPTVEIRIADPDAAGTGEIIARAPTVMLGYLGMHDETVDSEGWLRTGDLGHLNDEGYLFIDGRSKDMVIRGGENIACPHVEAALLRHPDVVEAAALGLPHPELGEELAAVVVHRPGGTVPTVDELTAHMAAEVAYFEIPTRWWIREQPLPTVGTEKLDKRTLAAEFD
ncbi:MAG TPA: class I adenylate-forming enzyme family protein [Mycobacterium sp.]|uniref:class I adenylate-forming enzyme family protein n=1 Tax=Mycolicibacterium sp. TaxID=2320850 RepID=UPI0025DF1C41|nr:class I adenylate-forming enzyme family protein [Mycolicibacterium sp.]HPX38558.1 class I adenylate-forming enzyme family protein [Mycobacterium sp.]HQC78607.1 class I adenylate-forming enzyme family protein [Mycobacterium sp.]